MGNVQGCILLLGTMLSSEDDQVTGHAKELLENLSCIDQNVIQMARANYFKPLLKLLSSGMLGTSVAIIMSFPSCIVYCNNLYLMQDQKMLKWLWQELCRKLS